jgi:hypothetical protein
VISWSWNIVDSSAAVRFSSSPASLVMGIVRAAAVALGTAADADDAGEARAAKTPSETVAVRQMARHVNHLESGIRERDIQESPFARFSYFPV